MLLVSVMLGGMPDAVPHGYKKYSLCSYELLSQAFFKKTLSVQHLLYSSASWYRCRRYSLLKNECILETSSAYYKDHKLSTRGIQK